MLITDTPAEPFDKVPLDTVGKLPTTPDGNRHILTMQNNFSKYCIAVPIPNLKTITIAHAVAMILFSQYGAPRAILTINTMRLISMTGTVCFLFLCSRIILPYTRQLTSHVMS